jgi:uncharacterized OB-fold protein
MSDAAKTAAPAKAPAMRFDLPTPEGDTQPFWDAAREGKLLVKRCAACGKSHFYPRPFCPHCWSVDVAWQQASGRGRLYTYSIVHQNDLPPFNQRVPYVAAIVDLDEGPRVMTNLVDVAHDAIAIGMAVEVAFQKISDDVTIPVFRPATA